MGDDTSITYFGSDANKRQYRNVLNFVPHPEFTSDTMEHDIAIIRVSIAVNIKSLEKKISLISGHCRWPNSFTFSK